MLLSTPALMPRTSTDAPPRSEVQRRNARVDGLELAAYRARKAVGCASNPVSMPSQNLRVDAAIAQSQLAATLPRNIQSFTGPRNDALPQTPSSPLIPEVIIVNGSGKAAPRAPDVWPQSLIESEKLIRRMQGPGGTCIVIGPLRERPQLPCGIAPGWGESAGVPPPIVRVNQRDSTGVLGWIRANPWPSIALAGAAVWALNRSGGRR